MVIQTAGWERHYQLLALNKCHVTKYSTRHQTRTNPSVRPKQWKKDMKFRTFNITSLYRSGSFATAARELETLKLYLVALQDVRWD